MARRRKLDQDKEKHWRLVMARFIASQLSIRAFCKQEGISSNTFQFWRKELRLRDEQKGLPATITKGQNAPSRIAEKTEFWLRIIDEVNSYPGSTNQFLREKKLSSGSLWHWEKRLVKEGRTDGITRRDRQLLIPVKVRQSQPAGTTGPQKAMVPSTGASGGKTTDQRIELRTASGTVIFLPPDTCAGVLIQLVKGISGIC